MKSSSPSYKTPSGWGEDQLSDFQSAAMQNEFATFANVNAWQKALSDIAADLSECSNYAIANILNVDEPSALLLFITAHNHFLASARLVTSGQCLSAYPTGRAAMESALYGWYLARNPGAAQRWHDKPTDRAELKMWNNEFSFSALKRELSKTRGATAEWAKYLHQTSIDFGAHPNQLALYSNMTVEKSANGRSIVQMTLLHSWNTISITTAKFVIETGIFAVSLFGSSFPVADRTYRFVAAGAGHAKVLNALLADTNQSVENDISRSKKDH